MNGINYYLTNLYNEEYDIYEVFISKNYNTILNKLLQKNFNKQLIKTINLPNNIKTCSFSFCKDDRGYDVDYCFYTANNINIKKKWIIDKTNYLKQFGNNLQVEYYHDHNIYNYNNIIVNIIDNLTIIDYPAKYGLETFYFIENVNII